MARKVTLIRGILTTDFLIVLLNFPSTSLDLTFLFFGVCVYGQIFL